MRIAGFHHDRRKDKNRDMIKRLCSVAALAVTMVSLSLAQNVRRMDIGQLFQLIEQNSKALKTRKTETEIAQEGVKSAKSQRLPEINASVSASYIGNAVLMDRDFTNVHGMSSPHFGNTFTLDAQQVIYAGGAVNAGIQLAKIGAEKASVGTEISRQGQRFMALSQYLDLQKIANREKVLRSNIQLTRQLIDNINEKHSQGVALKNDVTRYELQLQTLGLSLTQLENTRNILNHQLCNTLGIPVTERIEPSEDITLKTFGKEGEEQWQKEAVAANPQLRMARLDEDMSRQQVKLARSEMLPKVAVVANNNFNGPITFELPPIDKNLNIWYVGVGVRYSLSSLFKSNKKLSQARIASRQAREQTALAMEETDNNVQVAYTNYLQSYVELETQRKKVELANENYQVVNDRYLNQLALITDMVDAANMKLDAELGEVDARINIAYQYYKVRYVVGKL